MSKLDLSHPQNPLQTHEDTPTEAVAKETVKQKASLWIFIVIALITTLFGGISIYKQLTDPFEPKPRNANETGVVLGQTELQKLQELKTKDTDADTLNDYDELYVYDTSPYLADSDSDNASDAEELKTGQNPNCPTGMICDQPRKKNETQVADSGTTPRANTSSTVPPTVTNGVTNTNAEALDANTVQNQQSTNADILRQTLKNAGAPAEVIDAMSDEELLKLYEEIVQETGYNPSQTNSTSQATDDFIPDEVQNAYSDLLVDTQNPYGALGEVSAETLEQLKNLPAEEIRKLLIELGGDATMIQTIDDTTLRAVFLQAIKEIVQSQNEENANLNSKTENTNSAQKNTNQK